MFRLFCGSQVNSTFFADFFIMAVNIGDQLTGGLVDGLQAGPQLFQFLALTPACDVAETVFSGLDAVILADRVGNALSLKWKH